ncbi:MAG: aspartate carbamoyltransferase regulatory subunit [Euryarchaeota archaeon]|nr:aspartate carbamoyltransferase regulatory subunit [Euryarchaeota archaeon]|tara:strand:- start:2641 stop:3120 length:480 start_codon:yes stop_codon:yes gene_type:complete
MSADEQSMRRVTAIRNGTVIDHIPGGMVLEALQIFNVDGRQSNPISLVMNVPSRKLGTKDILKIEDRELTQDELDRLALIAPLASVSIIRNYSVAEKLSIKLSDEMVNVAHCVYSNCISNAIREPLPHRLKVLNTNPMTLQCHYCGRNQNLERLVENLL